MNIVISSMISNMVILLNSDKVIVLECSEIEHFIAKGEKSLLMSK